LPPHSPRDSMRIRAVPEGMRSVGSIRSWCPPVAHEGKSGCSGKKEPSPDLPFLSPLNDLPTVTSSLRSPQVGTWRLCNQLASGRVRALEQCPLRCSDPRGGHLAASSAGRRRIRVAAPPSDMRGQASGRGACRGTRCMEGAVRSCGGLARTCAVRRGGQEWEGIVRERSSRGEFRSPCPVGWTRDCRPNLRGFLAG
jgi:hypothetical protein